MGERDAAPTVTGTVGGAPRVLYYCHDEVGLGHVRRTLALATELERRRPDVGQVVVTGGSHFAAFALPPTLDYVKLPEPAKAALYAGRAARGGRAERVVQRIRAALIQTVARTYAPHLLLVDTFPLGWHRELAGALALLRAATPRVELVLGLRDIVTDPASVVARWRESGVYDLLERTYDRILVYGDREVFDPVAEYRFPPNVEAKTTFCGYVKEFALHTPAATIREQLGVGAAPLVVVTVGGGGGADGTVLLRRYLAALCCPELDGVVSFVVAGPNAEPGTVAQLEATAARRPRVTLVRFADELQSYLDAADLVVCLGGYNTTCEVVGLGKRALVVPRADYPEQRLRAARFAELGLVTVLDPDGLTPERLARAARDRLLEPPPSGGLDFGGAARAGEVLAASLASDPAAVPPTRRNGHRRAPSVPATPPSLAAGAGMRPTPPSPAAHDAAPPSQSPSGSLGLHLALVVDRFPESSAPFLVDRFLGLLGRGWDVFVVCRRSDQTDWDRFPELQRDQGVRERVHAAHSLRGELRKLEPDLVHFGSDRLVGIWPQIKADLGCKVAVSFGGAEVGDPSHDDPPSDDDGWVWKLVDAVHLSDRDDWRYAEQRGSPPDKVRVVIPPGVDVGSFAPDRGREDSVLGSPDRPLHLLGVGPLDWKQGYEYAAQAVRLLVDRGVSCEYRIVGEGSWREALIWLVRDLGLTTVVRLVGELPRAEVKEHMRWADVLLHAAVADGFPPVLLEAQAMRLPVVSSDADGLAADALDATTGFVVPRRDPMALADKLEVLAREPDRRQQMGRAGRRRVEARFRLDDQVARFDAFYRTVLNLEDGK